MYSLFGQNTECSFANFGGTCARGLYIYYRNYSNNSDYTNLYINKLPHEVNFTQKADEGSISEPGGIKDFEIQKSREIRYVMQDFWISVEILQGVVFKDFWNSEDFSGG